MSQIYTEDEAKQACLEYFGGDELASSVMLSKYLMRNNKGELVEKSPVDMHRRLSKEFARIEKKKFKEPLTEDFIFGLLDRFKYIVPQGSPMFGIGNPYQIVSLSNCFVVPSPADSYGGIFETDQHIAQISKRRGGIGYDISELRPAKLPVSNAAKTTTGATSFMHRFSNTGREVGQEGRRAAEMCSISVHHPDVELFATIKNDNTSVTGANISIRLTDEFLEAVDNNTEYEQRWPVTSKNPRISKKENARKVWNTIISSAHNRAEPGLLFWDRIIEESPADCYEEFQTLSTNPCGEVPLSAWDSCRLLCLNWYSYVKNPFTKEVVFDYDLFYEHSQIAQRLMDDIVDLESECIDNIINKIKEDPESEELKSCELRLWENVKNVCNNGRRTGTGSTGIGDTLAAMNLKYGSDTSIRVVGIISKVQKFGCYRSSVDMAKELGPFPVWNKDKEKDNKFLNRMKDEEISLSKTIVSGLDIWNDMQRYGRRSSALLTLAPTGTLSTLTQTTSGIEPAFMLSYTRRKKINPNDKSVKVDFVDESGDSWQEFIIYHPKVKEWMRITGETDITKSPWFGCCAEEIDWQQRVKLQAAVNRNIDHSISSTINLPENVTVEEVAKIYETAWKAGCKGVTVYRKNCRSGVLIDTKKKEESITKHDAPKRPKTLKCRIHHVVVKSVKYYIVVGLLGNDPYEVFVGRNSNIEGDPIIPKSKVSGTTTKKKQGEYEIKDENDESITVIQSSQCEEHEEAIARLTSIALRHGSSIQFVSESLSKVRGEMSGFSKSIARVLKTYIVDGVKSSEKCPECTSEQLEYSSGCMTCKQCGYSKCS